MALIVILLLALVFRYAIGATWGVSDAFNGAVDKVGNAYGGAVNASGVNLESVANNLGINYDESKKAAGTAAGWYLGGAYGSGLSALGVDAGAALGAGGGYAATDYSLRPDGTLADTRTAPYAASDTYGGYDQSKRDWFYNAEQNQQNKTGKGYTKDQFELAQAQYGSDQNRSNNLASIQQWQQSRNPYYASLYQQMTGDSNKALQQQYGDSLKQSQLQHAQRGTTGGSQAAYNQSQLNTRLATEQGKAAQGAQNYVQGIRQNDQQQAQTMAQQQFAPDPYLQAMYQSQITAAGQGSDDYKGIAAMQLAQTQNQQQYQNSMSQIFGGQIGTVGQGAQAYLGGAP